MADRYFLNNTTNFNDTANWSTTSGGASGASVPGASDRVILDANSGNLSLEININVQGILMDAAYAGTFTQGAFTIAYGSAHFTVNGGIFLGSASAITGSSSARFVMTGGSFTSTSGTLQVGVGGTGVYSLDITGGSFMHNGGTVAVVGSNHTNLRNLSGFPLNNLTVNTCGSCSIAGLVYVDGNLTMTLNNSGTAGGLVVNLKGHYVATAGAAAVVFLGSNNQDVTITTGIVTGSMTFNKTGGQVNIINDFAWFGNWTHTAGTINWNSKKAIARFTNNGLVITNGQFHHLENNSTAGVGITSAGTPIQCEGDFILNGQPSTGSFPAVKFRGNLSILTISGTCSGVEFNGTGAQSFTSSVASYTMPITINKASGAVTLMSNFSMPGIVNDFNLIAGTFNQNGFNLTISDALNQTGGTYNQGAGTLTVPRFLLTLGTFNEGASGIICTGSTFTVNPSAVFVRAVVGGGIFANSGSAGALSLSMGGYAISNLSFARATSSLNLGGSLIINGYFKKNSTSTTANVTGTGLSITIGGNIEQNGTYGSRTLSTSPTWILNSSIDTTIYAADGRLDSGYYQIDKPLGQIKQLSNVRFDTGQGADATANQFILLDGIWCTNEFNFNTYQLIIDNDSDFRKTPTSIMTVVSTIGIVLNVATCQKKTSLINLL